LIAGAISTVSAVDHETDSEFRFHVKVSDRGKPRLSAETMAHVVIRITDINDCPPIFSYAEYNATLVLPTYENVAVIQVSEILPKLNMERVLSSSTF